MLDQSMAAGRARRPRSVSFVASLVLAEAVSALILAGLTVAGLLTIELSGPTLIIERVLADAPAREVSAVAAGGLAAGLILTVAGIGLLRMHTWAWSLAVVVHGITLADALAGYAVGRPPYALMAIGSVVVLVLNQREIRQAFLPRDGRA